MGNLSDALQEWMEEQDIGQNKAADRIGISRETMHRLVQGEANPRRSTLVKIADTCDISPDELI